MTDANPLFEKSPLQTSLTPGKPASAWHKVFVVCFASLLIIVGIYVATPDELATPLSQEREGFDEQQNRQMVIGPDSPLLSLGIDDPEISPAGDTFFADGAPVLGISAGGRHRAYLIPTLQGYRVSGRIGSIVNDLVGDIPITVTHDNDFPLTAVFTSPQRGKRIPMRMTGMMAGGKMSITLTGESYYTQDDPNLLEDFSGKTTVATPRVPTGAKRNKDTPDLLPNPDIVLKLHPYEKTTWLKWRTAHPETDIYIGEFKTKDLQMEVTLRYMSADEKLVAGAVIKERDRLRKVLSPGRKKKRGSKKKRTGEPQPPASTQGQPAAKSAAEPAAKAAVPAAEKSPSQPERKSQ